jgi:hypothetical protein
MRTPSEHPHPTWCQLLRNEEQFLFPIVELVSLCIPAAIHNHGTAIFFLIFANKKGLERQLNDA